MFSSEVGNTTSNSPRVFITSILSTSPFGFPVVLGFVGLGFGCFFLELAPKRKSSASRSFLEVSFVRPVLSTVRATGAAGTVVVGDLGSAVKSPSFPPNNRSN